MAGRQRRSMGLVYPEAMNTTTWGLTILTIVLWGLIPVIDKVALGQHAASPLVGIAIRATAVALVAVPLAVYYGDGAATLRAMPSPTIGLYVASGVVSLLLAQYAYYALLGQADVSKVFPFLFSAAPLVTIALGVLALGETLSAKQALGALLVIGGGLLLL